MKRNLIKTEPTSSSRVGEKDLAYYIHDRVELMHQVFSLLKPKELRLIAPDSVRNLPVDDLEELCLEEVLGISSKRLCAILDGAEPPSDTDSSQHNEDAISLDSISSDEVQFDNDKSKKCHRRSKKKRSRKKSPNASGTKNMSATRSANKAGLTVLELLELQARARAIRAQLAKEKATHPNVTSTLSDDDDDVMISEVKHEVVELSSDDDVKPNVKEINITKNNSENREIATSSKTTDANIPQPQSKSGRIKLKRNNIFKNTNVNRDTVVNDNKNKKPEVSEDRSVNVQKDKDVKNKETNKAADNPNKVKSSNDDKIIGKSAKKKKVKQTKARKKSGSDDEITLQLSDTEKMDLLEDIDRKQCEVISTDSDTDEDYNDDVFNATKSSTQNNIEHNIAMTEDESQVKTEKQIQDFQSPETIVDPDIQRDRVKDKNPITNNESQMEPSTHENNDNVPDTDKSDGEISDGNEEKEEGEIIQDNVDLVEIENQNCTKTVDVDSCDDNVNKQKYEDNITSIDDSSDSVDDQEDSSDDSGTNSSGIEDIENDDERKNIASEKDTAIDKANIDKICIINDSDEEANKIFKKEVPVELNEESTAIDVEIKTNLHENSNENIKARKKKSKRKDEKLKKGRSVSKTSDTIKITVSNEVDKSEVIINNAQDTIDISDDSSCYEVEGITLSKEPTAEEIEALSAKIDAFERIDVVTETEIQEYEAQENVSWRERYLSSNKVKKVLTTSNIFNAIRKKNIELKRKLEENKLKAEEDRKAEEERKSEEEKKLEEKRKEEARNLNVEEGTIDHYNTLEGSTTYVDPVQEPKIQTNDEKLQEIKESNKLLIKDARQLLKMYKKMLKYSGEKDKSEKSKSKKVKKKKKKADKVAEDGND